jgi:tripartite motif-containing protein 71
MHKARSFFFVWRTVGAREYARLGLTPLLLGLISALAVLPSASRAQPPTYITQWGTEGSGSGQFELPHGVAVDAGGNVYVADTNNGRIQKFTGSGSYVTQWGAGAQSVAVDASGNVYSPGGYGIQKFNSSGTLLAQYGGGYGSGNGQFIRPAGVAVDAGGNVYVTDMDNRRVQKFAGNGAYLTQWGGSQFYWPYGVAADASHNVYVADAAHFYVLKFTDTGQYLAQVGGCCGTGDGRLQYPWGVAVDIAGNVYVADSQNHRIQVFTSGGVYFAQWGTYGSANGQFRIPQALAVDASYNVYVADTYNCRIQKFGPVPTPTTGQTWGGVKSRYRQEGTAKPTHDK